MRRRRSKRTTERVFRKRREKTFSSSLRRIGSRIHRGHTNRALGEINSLLASGRYSSAEQARLLALVGDSEFKRGRFADAARIQLQSASSSLSHPKQWLRPHIGQVRALLKLPDVSGAVMLANQAIAVAEAKMQTFDEQVKQANQLIRDGQRAVNPELPPRISVVATRLGYLFLDEGEPEMAKDFFQRAISYSKGGANRARQGLARIALAHGDGKEAFSVAANAIRTGGYRAKTIPAWDILVAARRQAGGWKISERLIRGLARSAPTVRAKSTLTIVKALRKHDMKQWRDVAAEWILQEGGQFPRVRKEMQKLMLATAKLGMDEESAEDRLLLAEELLAQKTLGPKDWLSAAKEAVRSSLLSGAPVNLSHLQSEAERRYGEHFVPRVRHSLALSCMMAKRHDLARVLLLENLQHCIGGSSSWGKSAWALARMEAFLDNNADAAALYKQVADASGIPVRFRLQARLLWTKVLVKTGTTGAILEAKEAIQETLRSVQDPDILMNFARQLQASVPDLRAWANEIFAQGAALAQEQFHSAAHPAVAVKILFKLTRRQVVDFSRCQDAIALWESLDDAKRDWLWSTNNLFWEYLGLLFEAYTRTGNPSEAEQLAQSLLDDPAAPPSGLPYIGIPYARWLMRKQRPAEAMTLFKTMTEMAPTHSLCAWGWYWQALQAYKAGHMDNVRHLADCLRLAQGNDIGLYREWALDARGLLLIANLNTQHVKYTNSVYDNAFLTRQMDSINHDLGALQ